MDYSRISNSNNGDLSMFMRDMWGLSANQSLVQTTIEDGRITDIQDLSALVYALMQSSMRSMKLQQLHALRDLFEGGRVQVMERHPVVEDESGEQRVTLKVAAHAKNELADTVRVDGQEVRADLEVDDEIASKVDMLASNLLLDLDLAIQQQEDSVDKPVERSRNQQTESSVRHQSIEGTRGTTKESVEVRSKRSRNQVSSQASEEKQVKETRQHRAKVKEADRQAEIKEEQVESLEQNRAKRKKIL